MTTTEQRTGTPGAVDDPGVGELARRVDIVRRMRQDDRGRELLFELIDTDAETLTCPWHGFCYDAASGGCMSAPGAQLEQLPLRVDDGYGWIRVSA